ncbi:MAG: hypothetical protein IPP83_06275 [Flavobacteriales bacterium]|nr:hypothetical protein [Flavobacteriales bacterium]
MRKILEAIDKNVNSKSWPCLYPGCQEVAINSHLLQRNSVLSTLVENGHLYELSTAGSFQLEPGRIREFKLTSAKKALSEPLFCNHHDHSVFLPIESNDSDWTAYVNQILFAYRSTCSELRKKQRAIETGRRRAQSNILSASWAQSRGPQTVEEMRMGIADLEHFKRDMEEDILSGTNHFEFVTCDFPILDVCASAVFTPVVNPIASMIPEEPVSTEFLNIIPTNGRLKVIVGHHKIHVDSPTLSHVHEWSKMDAEALEQKLTNLFASRLETWCLSPRLYRQIPKGKLTGILQFWNNPAHHHLYEEQVDFNLFR